MIENFKAQIRGRIGGQLSKTIFKNSSLNAFRTVLVSILSFVTIPIVLNKLGTENYGVWALVIAFASYANFLELGFNSAVTRLVAQGGQREILTNTNKKNISDNPFEIRENPSEKMEERGGKEENQENTKALIDIAEQINSTVITYLMVSFFIFTVVLIFYPFLKSLMFKNINVANLDLFILGTLGLYFLNLVTSNYMSVLTGRMRMDLTNLIAIFVNCIQTGLTIGLLFAGYGLMAIFVGSAVAGFLNSLLPVIFAKREFPELFFDLKQYNFGKIKPLFKFSLKMYFMNSVSNFLSSTNKFIIVRLTGLDFVAYYEIANKVVLQLRILFQNILEPVYPAASIVVSENHQGASFKGYPLKEAPLKVVKAYNKAFKYLLVVGTLGYGAMIIFSYPVFLIWLGKKFAQVSLITIIIGIGNFVNLQTAIPFYFLSAMNKLKLPLLSSILVLICNFVLGGIGYFLFDFYGLIGGFSLALILPSIWFIWVGKKEVLIVGQVRS
jgi:O-antigen/teichoic acid export membrane protein